MFDSIEKAIDVLKVGGTIIVCDDEDRENEGDFLALAEFASAETINFMATHARGLICMPITQERADQLKLDQMVGQNTDSHGTAFTVSVDHVSTTTGISAHERALTVRAMVDDSVQATDFKRPGHIFPLVAKRGGVLKRTGHTEAAVDFAMLAGSKYAGVICEVMNEDGSMARVPELRKLADHHELPMVTIKDLIAYRRKTESFIKKETEVQMPTEYGDFKAIGYTNAIDDKESVALVKGDLTSAEPVLVRVHSECLTGDVFGSKRCDCGPQLHAALRQIEEAGRGVLLYMKQEGRGIGLINKLKAYKLQEEGFDTVEANEKLGFPADLRDYGIGAQILRDLGIRDMKLMTNNPRKIAGLEGYDLKVVERVALQLEGSAENANYLQTKKEKLGHLLNL